ncbi:ribonuclease R [Derxia lacustris]|uniref:ribonuclease R n=1 Tax=Derxia lacustris TaxID=764842 RepID=UPI000A16EFB6|nr:ribonuclease R [Derxia lacustris]
MQSPVSNVSQESDSHPYPIPSREDILRVLRASSPELLTPIQLAAQLGVTEREMEGFSRRIGAMERDGQLLPNRKGVLLLATKLDFIAGRVIGHRDGFGFLHPDDGAPDIYLPPKEMLKVLHGDRVLVRISGMGRNGRSEGSIVEVTERRTDKLVGRFISERGVFVVVPEDQRIKHDILIPPGEQRAAQPGQVVVAQIIEQPSRYSQPIGRVIEVLGEIDDPGMEIEIAVRKFDVPHVFSDEAKALAAKLPDEVRAKDLKARVDLRDVPLVTIDGEDARDFDDAIYVERFSTGRGRTKKDLFRLLVAIADVSHYVTPGDALDADAVERSTSVYFPRRVIPMLPEKLSNGLCSLNPDVDRLCLVADMVIDTAGDIVAYQFYPAVMHSQARFTYTEVWNILSNPEFASQLPTRRAALVPHLQDAYDLFKTLLAGRQKRGAIEFETTETYIVCNAVGKIEQIIPRTRNDAHRLIEECMLAANVSAADFILRSKHPSLFRIHEGPTPEKLANLRTLLKTIGMHLGGGDEPTPGDYAALMELIKQRSDAPLLQTVLLRSMQQAIYSPDNVGHFGLAYAAYAHFTSPIRRYPDLLVHRTIKAILEGRQYVPDAATPAGEGEHVKADLRSRSARGKQAQAEVHERWGQLGAMCSANERRADDASRDVQAWLKCFYMRERVGEQYSGRISGIAPFGVFITLDNLYVEGMCHVSELGAEYFQFNEAFHELRGERTGQRYRLGDAIHVQVSRVDLEARKIDFRLVKATTHEELSKAAARVVAAEGRLQSGEPGDAKPAPAKRSAPKRTPEKVAASKAGAQAKQRRGELRKARGNGGGSAGGASKKGPRKPR